MSQHAPLNMKELIQSARDLYRQPPKPGATCPPEDVLVDYAHHQLRQELSEQIAEHCRECESCRMMILKMGTERIVWDNTLDEGVQAIVDDMQSMSKEPTFSVNQADVIARYVWEIEEGGYLLTGKTAGVTKEETFQTELGPIKVICAWGDAVDEEPAFIWLSWDYPEANLSQYTFAIQFVHPETRTLFFAVPPEIVENEDQRTFSRETLGFDPVREKWSIEIAIIKRS